MGSSDSLTIHPVLELTQGFQPKSVLDVGCGNGKYGFLFREILDMNYGRFQPDSWEVQIDGVDIFPEYKNPIHDHFYNNVYWEDWLEWIPARSYDMVFMGDVLEHFGQWEKALEKAQRIGKFVIVVCPNHDASIQQGALFGNPSEKHRVVLNPVVIGGKCVWANTKAFVSVCSDYKLDIHKGVLL